MTALAEVEGGHCPGCVCPERYDGEFGLALSSVAAAFGVPSEAIMGERGDRATAHARHALMFVLRAGHGWTFPRIGAQLRRDHSSAVYGCGATLARIRSDAAYRVVMTSLMPAGVPVPETLAELRRGQPARPRREPPTPPTPPGVRSADARPVTRYADHLSKTRAPLPPPGWRVCAGCGQPFELATAPVAAVRAVARYRSDAVDVEAYCKASCLFGQEESGHAST